MKETRLRPLGKPRSAGVRDRRGPYGRNGRPGTHAAPARAQSLGGLRPPLATISLPTTCQTLCQERPKAHFLKGKGWAGVLPQSTHLSHRYHRLEVRPGKAGRCPGPDVFSAVHTQGRDGARTHSVLLTRWAVVTGQRRRTFGHSYSSETHHDSILEPSEST